MTPGRSEIPGCCVRPMRGGGLAYNYFIKDGRWTDSRCLRSTGGRAFNAGCPTTKGPNGATYGRRSGRLGGANYTRARYSSGPAGSGGGRARPTPGGPTRRYGGTASTRRKSGRGLGPFGATSGTAWPKGVINMGGNKSNASAVSPTRTASPWGTWTGSTGGNVTTTTGRGHEIRTGGGGASTTQGPPGRSRRRNRCRAFGTFRGYRICGNKTYFGRESGGLGTGTWPTKRAAAPDYRADRRRSGFFFAAFFFAAFFFAGWFFCASCFAVFATGTGARTF